MTITRHKYNTLFVSAVNNQYSVSPPGTSYNCIGVGAYGGSSSVGPTLDNGRAKPDIVAPASETSYSTPLVAGAAAVLMQSGLRGDGGSDTNSAADIRTVKALLLNGAVKPSDWTNTAPSPLDFHYGAGVLNVFNSYEQLAGGKQGLHFFKQHSCRRRASARGTHKFNRRFERMGLQHQYQQHAQRQREPLFLQCHQHFRQCRVDRHRDAGLEPPAKPDEPQQSRFVFIQCRQQQPGRVQHEPSWTTSNTFSSRNSRKAAMICKSGKLAARTLSAIPKIYALAWEFFPADAGDFPNAGASVIVSWPIYPAGFLTVESTTNLSAPINWSTNNLPPLIFYQNGQNQITIARRDK